METEEKKKKHTILKRTLIIILALVAAVALTVGIVFAYFFGKSNYKRDEDVSRLTISDLKQAADSADSEEAEALKGLTDESDILSEAERELLREQQYAVKLPENKDIYKTSEEVIKVADELMYYGKQHGKNIVIYKDEET